MHRQIFKLLSGNPENIQAHCNDRKHAFHFARHKWYLKNNPQ